MTSHRRALFTLLIISLFASPALAEEIYVSIPLASLHIEGKLPQTGDSGTSRAELYPRVTVDLPGAEAYLKTSVGGGRAWWRNVEIQEKASLTIRLPKIADLTGRLFLPSSNLNGQVVVPFTLAAKDETNIPDAKNDFLLAKRSYYSLLASFNLPGGAWFRHQLRVVDEQLDRKVSSDLRNFDRTGDEDSEFAILSGGRALAENLQLDRALVAHDSDKPPVDISTLEGITVKKFDWTPLVKDIHPDLDPLASLIPADQHALFFPSTQAFATFIAEAGKSVLPVLEYTAENSVQDERIADRYSRQLCLPLADLDKKIPAELVSSIAVTGSDPSLRTGSAVTLLFETADAKKLFGQLDRHIAEQAGKFSQPEIFNGAHTWQSPDRSVSVILANIDGAIIVTNSPQQMHALFEVHSKKSPALASLDEYRYFRHRYPRTDKDETAFLIISDDTLRRWCGPKLRIAEAHRVRAAAILADAQAAALENPDASYNLPSELKLDHRHDLGPLDHINGQVHSQVYNTLAFLTPADELDLKTVPAADADSYKRWHNTYQQNWRQYFDPIALRLSLQKNKIAADLTIMPLIENSSYKKELFTWFNGKFPPDAADPHNALLQFVVGLDVTKPPLSEMLPSLLPLPGKGGNPFRWIGNNATLYIDDDPLWQELAKADHAQEFLTRNVARLPIALRFSCNNPLGQVAFLASIRGFVETSSPGMLTYTILNHHDQPYVKVTPAKPDQVGLAEFKDLAIYYVPAPDFLLVTLNEPLLKRAIDRRAAASTQSASQPATPIENRKSKIENPEWLGRTLAAHLDADLLRLGIHAFTAVQGEDAGRAFQQQAWASLPILNDLKRLRPNEDALALYTKTFHQTPVDPLGGTYSWDEKLQTYTSSTLGNPAAEKTTTQLPPAIESLRILDFGLTLEDNNLRARATLERAP